MPIATVRLEPWSDLNRTEFSVTFDPATITVLPSDSGCLLQVQLTISPEGHLSTDSSLIAVHGMASFAIQDARAGVEIPMQSLPVNERQLRIPLTTVDLERIEVRRAFGPVICQLNLHGLANIPFRPHTDYQGAPQAIVTVPVRSNQAASFTIEREHWLTILKRAQFGSRRLVELPSVVGPAASEWVKCNTLLQLASTRCATAKLNPRSRPAGRYLRA